MVATGSVASTVNVSPGRTLRIAFAVRSTGSGQWSPVASRVPVIALPVIALHSDHWPPMLILPSHILQLRCGDGDRRALRSRKVAVSRLRAEGARKVCNEAGLYNRPRRRRAELPPDRRHGPLEPP